MYINQNQNNRFDNYKNRIIQNKIETDEVRGLVPADDPENEDPEAIVLADVRDNLEAIDKLYEGVLGQQPPEAPQETLEGIKKKRWEILTKKYDLFTNLKTYLEKTGKQHLFLDQYLKQTEEQLVAFDGMLDDPLLGDVRFRELVKENLHNEDPLDLFSDLQEAFALYMGYADRDNNEVDGLKTLEEKIKAQETAIEGWKTQRQAKVALTPRQEEPNKAINLDKEIKYLVELKVKFIETKAKVATLGRKMVAKMRQDAITHGKFGEVDKIDDFIIPKGRKWTKDIAREIKVLRGDIKRDYEYVIGSREAPQARVQSPQSNSRASRALNFILESPKKLKRAVWGEEVDLFGKLPDMDESWDITSWGHMMLKGDDKGEFKDTINKIKKENRALKVELQHLAKRAEGGEDVTAKNVAIGQQIQANKMIMHHMILMQVVTQIRNNKIDEKAINVELKTAEEDLQKARAAKNFEGAKQLHREIAKLEVDLQRGGEDLHLLESTYARYFAKYSTEYKNFENLQDKSALEKAWISVMKLVPQINKVPQIDYLRTPTELYREKTYAEFGKDRLICARQLLEPLFTAVANKDNAAIKDWATNNIQGFTEWSGRHPEEAVIMTADILQTIGEAGSQGLLDQFKGRLTAIGYVCSNFAQQRVHEPITNEDDLKYFALADYAPLTLTAVSFGKGLANGFALGSGFVNNYVTNQPLVRLGVGMAVGLGAGLLNVVKTNAVRELSKAVDIESNPIVTAITGIMTGEELYTTFQNQQTEAVKEIVFGAQGVLTDRDFRKEVKSQAKIWWNSIWKSKGTEFKMKASTQIALPTVGVGLLGAAAFFLLTGPIGWGVGAALGLAGLACITASWVSGRLLNTVYRSTLEEARNAEISNVLLSGDHAIQHRQLVAAYMKDLKQNGLIPDLRKPNKKAKEDLNRYKDLVSKAKERFSKQLQDGVIKRELEIAQQNQAIAPKAQKKQALTAKDYAKVFSQIKVKDVRKELENEIATYFDGQIEREDAKGKHLYLPGVDLIEIGVEEIVTDLESEWLYPKVDAALHEQAIDVYKNTGREDPMIEKFKLALAGPNPGRKSREKVEEHVQKKLEKDGYISSLLPEDRATVLTLVGSSYEARFKRHEPSAPEMLPPNPPAEVPLVA